MLKPHQSFFTTTILVAHLFIQQTPREGQPSPPTNTEGGPGLSSAQTGKQARHRAPVSRLINAVLWLVPTFLVFWVWNVVRRKRRLDTSTLAVRALRKREANALAHYGALSKLCGAFIPRHSERDLEDVVPLFLPDPRPPSCHRNTKRW